MRAIPLRDPRTRSIVRTGQNGKRHQILARPDLPSDIVDLLRISLEKPAARAFTCCSLPSTSGPSMLKRMALIGLWS
jgi:hypothetical protein